MSSVIEGQGFPRPDLKIVKLGDLDSIQKIAKAQHEAAYMSVFNQLSLPAIVRDHEWRMENYVADYAVERFYQAWNDLHASVALSRLGYGTRAHLDFHGRGSFIVFEEAIQPPAYNFDPDIESRIAEMKLQEEAHAFFDFGALIGQEYYGQCKVVFPRIQKVESGKRWKNQIVNQHNWSIFKISDPEALLAEK